MLDIEDKILEALKELERWENRQEKVKLRIQNNEGDSSELERIEEQINYYQKLLSEMKKKISSTDLSRTIARSGNQ